MNNTILLVDDEPSILNALECLLSKDGYKILVANSGNEGLELLKGGDVQVVISDQRMPYMTGCEFLTIVKQSYPNTVRMVLSGQADFEAVKDAINEGAIYKFLSKPWDNKLLREYVKEAFQIHHQHCKGMEVAKVLETSLEGVMITDDTGKILQVNPMFTTITQYTEEDAKGKHLNLYDDTMKNIKLKKVIDQTLIDTGQWHGEVWKRRKNGDLYPEWLSVTTMNVEPGSPKQFIHLFLDITDQKSMQDKLNNLMYFDKLTGLRNRLYFIEELTRSIDENKKKHDLIGVLWLDIDNFSQLNNSFGHHIGDKILQQVANRLKKGFGDDVTIARLANDDYVALLAGTSDIKEIKKSISHIMSLLSEKYTIADKEIYITFSIGVSICPTDCERYDVSMEKAKISVDKCKELGGSGIQFYNVSMERKELIDVTFNAELHRALEKGEFVLHYQPILSLSTQKIYAVEALIRWQHPKRGLLMPKDFIVEAAASNMIISIDRWVIENAFHELKAWHDMGNYELLMSVNISSRHLNQPGLYDCIKENINAVGIDPKYFILEVSESFQMNDIDNNIILLNKLADIGLNLALDDFGTGFSSLGYLKKFPFNILKIDKSLVDEIGVAANTEALLIATITMGKSLGLTIVAEGVETRKQLEFLEEHECDQVQGYLFAKPQTADDILTHLSNNGFNQLLCKEISSSAGMNDI